MEKQNKTPIPAQPPIQNQTQVQIDIKTSRFGGRIELAPITVVLGPPGAGKTSLLRIIAGALNGDVDKLLVACETLNCEVWVDGRKFSECSTDECVAHYRDFYNVLYIPSDFETILKGGKSYEDEAMVKAIRNILELYSAGYRETTQQCVPEFKDPFINSELVWGDEKNELREAVGDRSIHISLSSTAVKLLVLEDLAKRGLLDRFDYILMDQPDAGLHPVHVARLAAWMHALAACGKKIIIATHNLFLVDVLYKVARLKELGLAQVEPQEVAVYYLDGHAITPVPQWASSLGDYTDFVLKFYGLIK